MTVGKLVATRSALRASGPFPASVMIFGESPFADRRVVRTLPDPGELLLHRALADVGIEPDTVRFTSAAQPDVARADQEGPTCWVVPLVGEVLRVQPRVLVLLGSSAARTLLGPRFAPRRQRGCLLPAPSVLGLECPPALLVTAHPGRVHRSRHRAHDYTAMVRDLHVAASCLASDETLDVTDGRGTRRAEPRTPSRT